jgi:hypothetical protein
MIDDMLQEDKSRVEIFKDYAKKSRDSVWGPFLNMLNRPDGFIVNQVNYCGIPGLSIAQKPLHPVFLYLFWAHVFLLFSLIWAHFVCNLYMFFCFSA